MKNVVVCIFICNFLLVSNKLYAQDMFGKATYKYKFAFSDDTLTGNLFFNNIGESQYITKSIKKMREIVTDPNITPKIIQRVDSNIIYRNILSRKQFYNKSSFMKEFLVSDTLKDINWELLTDVKKIGNFSCSSAKTKYAGRNYVVWYTTEISTNSGPWKFFGLPGLILEAKDDLGVAHFIINTIETSSHPYSIFKVNELEKKSIKKEDFIKEEEKYIEKLKAQTRTMGGKLEFGSKPQRLELEEN